MIDGARGGLVSWQSISDVLLFTYSVVEDECRNSSGIASANLLPVTAWHFHDPSSRNLLVLLDYSTVQNSVPFNPHMGNSTMYLTRWLELPSLSLRGRGAALSVLHRNPVLPS